MAKYIFLTRVWLWRFFGRGSRWQNFEICTTPLIRVQQFFTFSYKLHISPFGRSHLPTLAWLPWIIMQRQVKIEFQDVPRHAAFPLSSPCCCLCLWCLCLNPVWCLWGSWHHRPGHLAWKPWKWVDVTVTALQTVQTVTCWSFPAAVGRATPQCCISCTVFPVDWF